MVIRSGLRSTALALLGLAPFSIARADSNPPARAVISGTGSDVKIVYRVPVAPPSRPPLATSPSAPDPLAEALALKKAGSTDQAVLSYLTRNELDLPDVIDADVIKDLRHAGAGDSVIAFLTTSAAIGIGETGEGSDVQPQIYADAAPYAGAFPDAISMGYPFYGNYGGGYFPGGFRPNFRNGNHGAFTKRTAFPRFGHPSHPAFPRPRPLPAGMFDGGGMGHRTR